MVVPLIMMGEPSATRRRRHPSPRVRNGSPTSRSKDRHHNCGAEFEHCQGDIGPERYARRLASWNALSIRCENFWKVLERPARARASVDPSAAVQAASIASLDGTLRIRSARLANGVQQKMAASRGNSLCERGPQLRPRFDVLQQRVDVVIETGNEEEARVRLLRRYLSRR